MNHSTMKLRTLVERVIEGGERAKEEFEKRCEIPWEQVGRYRYPLRRIKGTEMVLFIPNMIKYG
ncbi:hypothetical protein F0342_20900 [Bacillus sp. CH30_1T]|uniref:hypothetical protein n=1 Tax=Bacillus sp. CH30_1T TaxID=2604836 RepID=UPI0011ED67D0|nr:hypothetical protein [Bacillus sp. CH30_1T]KAA0560823.1 hypothetical protein F0342_20900 [Bacillus sp. CH30_1T]